MDLPRPVLTALAILAIAVIAVVVVKGANRSQEKRLQIKQLSTRHEDSLLKPR